MTIKRISYTFSTMIALALAGALPGCAADATDSAEQIGESSAALISPAFNVEFPGQYRINDHYLLILGGYDVTNSNNGVQTAGLYHKDGATEEFLPLRNSTDTADNPLPVALGEVEIVKLDTDKYLVAGGRSVKDGSASTFTRILTLNLSGHMERASWATPGQLAAGRAGSRMMPCGSSKVIVFGGASSKGMEDLGATMGARNTIEVFDPAANSGAGAWSALRNSNNTSDVTLNAARAYPFVVADPASPTQEFAVAGGVNSGALLATTDRISVDSSCVLTSTSTTATASGNLPAARAQGASLEAALVISTVTYDALAIGGISAKSAQSVASSVYAFDFSASSGAGAWSSGASLSTARAFPRAFIDGAGSVYAVGGVVNSGDTLFSSPSDKKQALSLSGNSWGSESSMNAARSGLAAEYIDSAVHAAFGTSAYPSTAVQSIE